MVIMVMMGLLSCIYFFEEIIMHIFVRMDPILYLNAFPVKRDPLQELLLLTRTSLSDSPRNKHLLCPGARIWLPDSFA
jgi:hypothetical protein